MDISFIIITNGKNNQKLINQIKSIQKQKIKNYEIIISGITDLKFNEENIIYKENEQKAKSGSLGGLRNEACNTAKYENLVISDDDMLFSLDWYSNAQKNQEFDILTPKIKLPDGTRFWDNACYMSPEKGHIILNHNETDDYLYMSGGQSWIMKKYVFDKIKWDEDILIYNMKNINQYTKGMHNEDTDYSLKCRKSGFKIKYVPQVLVYHDDATYTSIGRVVRRRTANNNQRWCFNFNFNPDILYKFGIELFEYGYQAEGFDLMRKLEIQENNFLAKQFIENIEANFGGKLEDSIFTFDNIEYNNILKSI
jgi:hypothetical protein